MTLSAVAPRCTKQPPFVVASVTSERHHLDPFCSLLISATLGADCPAPFVAHGAAAGRIWGVISGRPIVTAGAPCVGEHFHNIWNRSKVLEPVVEAPQIGNPTCVGVVRTKMLPKNPSSGRKRPIARYKPPMAVAIARTKRAKRLGLIAPDAVPSHMPAGRKRYDDAWEAKNPNYWPMYNARRRQRRANAKALKTAAVNSAAFYRACMSLPDFPRDPKDQLLFVWLAGIKRGPVTEPSPPWQQPRDVSGEFGPSISVVPSRPRRRRIAAKLPEFDFVAS